MSLKFPIGLVGEGRSNATPPLDDYPARGAWSLRLLSSAWVGNVAAIRRDTDDTIQGFTAAEITDGTLEAFVGAGNNGYVSSLYDQSNHNLHMTQSALGRQPKVVDNGSLIMVEGKPAMFYDGVGDSLVSADLGVNDRANYASFYMSFSIEPSESKGTLLQKYTSSSNYSFDAGYIQNGSTSTDIEFRGSFNDEAPPYLIFHANGEQVTPDLITRDMLHTAYHTGSRVVCSIENIRTSLTRYGQSILRPLAKEYDTGMSASGHLFECIYYLTAQENRVEIESNMMAY